MQRGQAFTVFRILIGAVFAIGLLYLTYTLVSHFSYPYPGFDTTRGLVLQAQKGPPGKCFARETVIFYEGELLSSDLISKDFTTDFDWNPNYNEYFSANPPTTQTMVSEDLKEVPVSVECTADKKKCHVKTSVHTVIAIMRVSNMF